MYFIESDIWITNKNIQGINRCLEIFQPWLNASTESNRKMYKVVAQVTKSIQSHELGKTNYETLGVNPTAITIYKTLESTKIDKIKKTFPT